MAEPNRGLEVGKTVLRAVELVFALIVLGCSASIVSALDGAGGTGMAVFTSLTSIIICIAFLVPACCPGRRGIFEGQTAQILDVVFSSIWMIFWLAAAAALADHHILCWLVWFKSGNTYKTSCAVWSTAEAFSFLSWFAWIASLVLPSVQLCSAHRAAGGGFPAWPTIISTGSGNVIINQVSGGGVIAPPHTAPAPAAAPAEGIPVAEPQEAPLKAMV